MVSVNMEQIIQLPKIELHAHLTGSVRDSTVLELLKAEILEKIPINEDKESYIENEMKKYKIHPSKTMDQCFQIFGLLHRLLKKRENLVRVTQEILADFNEENTIYLELRTTPRNIYDDNNQLVVSKREYVNTIVQEIRHFEANHRMVTRLILSVDRTKGLEDAIETVELCREMKNKYIVGIDFSGNPLVSSFQDYDQVFKLIKDYGLKTTVHIAEFWEDPDLDYILKTIRPERIGHAVCLNKHYQKYLLEQPIPIEICPTSNLLTKLVESIDDHPFNEFWSVNEQYPLVICTDDRGMFNTTHSNEQFLICQSFKLTLEQIFALNKRCLDIIFDQSRETKDILEACFNDFKENFL